MVNEHQTTLNWERYVVAVDRINGFGAEEEHELDYETKCAYEEKHPEFAERYDLTFCGVCGERLEGHDCKG